MDLGHHLHQALGAHAALRVRIEAGLDRDHAQDQQRIDTDLAPRQVSGLHQLRGSLCRHAILASDVLSHHSLLARAAQRGRIARVKRHALCRDLRGQVGHGGYLAGGLLAPVVRAGHGRQACGLGLRGLRHRQAQLGRGHIGRGRRHCGFHQHRGRFLAGQRTGQGRTPFLADRQRYRSDYRHDPETVQGIFQCCATAP